MSDARVLTRRRSFRLANRRGTSSLGCLTMLAVFVGLVYVGMQVGQPYFRFYQYRDAIKQEARFATLRTDDLIRQNIWAAADSLSLPEGAYHMRIARTQRTIQITGAYEDTWTVASYSRPVHFDIDIENNL